MAHDPETKKDDRVNALLDLYREQMEHFRHTEQIEWKGNFGVWTLLAGAIYLSAKESIRIDLRWPLPLLGIAWLSHAFWLYKIHRSEVFDKELWTRYRAEALRLIRNTPVHPDEQPWKRRWWEELMWLVSEIVLTFLLCAFLLYFLTLHRQASL